MKTITITLERLALLLKTFENMRALPGFTIEHTAEILFNAQLADSRPQLSVDNSQDRPFYCSICGRTYEACQHWGFASNDAAGGNL
jgi:hypothetical protein